MQAIWRAALAAALAVAIVSIDQARAGDHYSLGIPGNAPFTGLRNGHVTGIIAEATVFALETMGRSVRPQHLPFKRMYKWVHTGRLDVAVSVLRTPQRATLSHYSAPIATEYTVVVVPKGRTFPLQRLTDLQGKRIGGQLGFQYPQLAATAIELIREKEYQINLKKVATGKLDGALIGSITGPYLVESLGLSDKIEFLPTAIGAVPLGAAFNKAVFSDADLATFDAAIKNIQASPTWRKILSANNAEELVKEWPVLTK